jgi:hypothetical protein
LVGDQALEPHDEGNLSNLLAQALANSLQAQGHNVMACGLQGNVKMTVMMRITEGEFLLRTYGL